MSQESERLRAAKKLAELQPEDPGARQELVLALSSEGHHEEAVQRGLALAQACPREPSAWTSLGLAMQRAGTWEGAEMAYRRSLLLRPLEPVCMGNLGIVLRERGSLQEALGFFQRSLELDGGRAEVWSSYGNALLEAGVMDEAVRAQTRAVELDPDQASLWANLSNGYRKQGNLELAMGAVERGLLIDPDLPGLHWNQALVQLTQGELESGFQGYEWRYRRPGKTPPPWIDRAWTGELLEGRVLELHTEQGFGDAIQFARFVALAAQRVPEVVLRTHPRMVEILSSTPGLSRVLPRDAPAVEGSVHHYLMSLPAVLGARELSGAPYLRADSQRVVAWRRRLNAVDRHPDRLRVGICWQGNPSFAADGLRSPSLECLAPLAEVPGIRLVSLQKHHGLDQLEQWRVQMGIEDLGSEMDNGNDAFVDTAALMKSLDLVVTSDTAMAHLAGALGIETWVALNSSPDWRWGLSGDRCPWYETMRLFRQPFPGAWDSVFSQIAEALAERMGKPK